MMVMGFVAKNMCSSQSPAVAWVKFAPSPLGRGWKAEGRENPSLFLILVVAAATATGAVTAMTKAVMVVAAAMAGGSAATWVPALAAGSSSSLSSTAAVGSGDTMSPVHPALVVERL